MRKFFLLSAATLTMALTGCSSGSDSDPIDLCASTNCLNGGVCIDGTCDCPDGYSGVNCAIPVTPVKVKITNIRVTKFPNVDGGGSAWDTGSGAPDIYIQVDRDGGGTPILVYESPNFFQNVLSTGSNYFDFTPASPIQITQVNTGHVISLLDYDTADTVPSPDDLMGAAAFYPYQGINGFPATRTLNHPTLNLTFVLSLTYEW